MNNSHTPGPWRYELQPTYGAREQYAATHSEAVQLIEAIRDELVSHQQANGANPSWGAVGDLKHVAALLSEIRAFVSTDGYTTLKDSHANSRGGGSRHET